MPKVTKQKTYRRIPKRKVKKTAPKHRRMFRGGKGCGKCSGGAHYGLDKLAKRAAA